MDDESPFRSPQILDAEEPLDERSERILQWRKAHRRLELGIPALALSSIMGLASFREVVHFLLGDFSQWSAFVGSWIFPAVALTVVISFALLPRFSLSEILRTLLLTWIPLLAVVGLIAAFRKVQAPLRAEGLQFGWLGPSEQLLLGELRHRDGSPVDPKTLGGKG
ncbi:hypothetical protein AB1K70_14575 [Bremerella sp. JC770]|uniref:hypothetical protein n=1 Tax=Bremerella sp. JC770 TaxID=3232137 RepID=UPI00345A89C0